MGYFLSTKKIIPYIENDGLLKCLLFTLGLIYILKTIVKTNFSTQFMFKFNHLMQLI